MLVAALGDGAALAQQPAAARTIAKLIDVQGNVLVSQADAMAAATNEQRLAPGARILTTAGAKATVVYDKGCSVTLGLNQRYTVRERAECTPARAPEMGKVIEFGILAGSGIRNTGETLVEGDLGVSPGTAVTGFPPGRVNGHMHRTDVDAGQAQKDALKAYQQMDAQECNVSLAGQDLGGLTLTPGVYCFPAAPAQLTGELILDPQGDPDAVFVFQVGTTLTTAANSSIRVKNGGSEGSDTGAPATDRERKRETLCHVYWQVGTSVSLGKESQFLGNIFAVGDIEIANKGHVSGRALARNGQLTLDTGVDQLTCLPIVAWVGPATAAAIGTAAGTVGIIDYERKPKSPN
jgi:hypothetical protein